MCKEIFGLMGALGASASSSALGAATAMALSAGTTAVLKYTAAAAIGGASAGVPLYFYGKARERNELFDLNLAATRGICHKDGPGGLSHGEAADGMKEALKAEAAKKMKAMKGKLTPKLFVGGVAQVDDEDDELAALKAELAALRATITKKSGK